MRRKRLRDSFVIGVLLLSVFEVASNVHIYRFAQTTIHVTKTLISVGTTLPTNASQIFTRPIFSRPLSCGPSFAWLFPCLLWRPSSCSVISNGRLLGIATQFCSEGQCSVWKGPLHAKSLSHTFALNPFTVFDSPTKPYCVDWMSSLSSWSRFPAVGFF